MHSAVHLGDEQWHINSATGGKMAAVARPGLLYGPSLRTAHLYKTVEWSVSKARTFNAQVLSQVLHEVQSKLPQERRKSTRHAQIPGKYQTQAGAWFISRTNTSIVCPCFIAYIVATTKDNRKSAQNCKIGTKAAIIPLPGVGHFISPL